MVWPFTKKSRADAAIEILDDAIAYVAEKWSFFIAALVFKDGTPLRTKMDAFLAPISTGLKKNFPPLADAPDTVILLVVAKGIEQSGTASRHEIEEALGAPLPD